MCFADEGEARIVAQKEAVMDPVEKEIIAVLEGLDETGNAALGKMDGVPQAGNPHYTMSQRWAYARKRGGKGVWKYCVICKLLTWMFEPFNLDIKNYDHCDEAIRGFPDNLPWSG